MRIGNSSIAMSSQRSYQEATVIKTASVVSKSGSEVSLDFENGKSLFDQMTKAQEERSLDDQMEQLKAESVISRPTYNASGMKCISSIRELKSLVLEQLLSRLEGKKAAYSRCNQFMSSSFSQSISQNMSSGTAIVENSGKYVRQTVQSAFYSEQEVTQFQTTGTVTTEDGKQFDISFSFEMSRTYMESIETYSEEEFVLCDPLVINFTGDVTELSDQKFFFDLDCDGEEEEISQFASNSGFLALDNNGDGVINDGSELFGTQSGDGFADLAQFDLDNNGWIDEDDRIFEKLKVWTKDQNGNNILMNLHDSGVGAIYLGTANTRFSLNSLTDNSVNGVIRNSGICLMESGEVNTVMHVDFAV